MLLGWPELCLNLVDDLNNSDLDLVRKFHGTRYQRGSCSLSNAGNEFHFQRSVSFSIPCQKMNAYCPGQSQ